MKRTIVAMLFAVLALFVITGCGGKGGGGGPEPLSKEAQADRELGLKLTAYVELGNRFFDRAYSSRRRYFSWQADPATPPTCKERHISWGLYTIYKTDKAAEKIQKANEMKPRMKKLEDAATKVLVALDKLEPLLKKAKRYYSQKDFKDDGCKGAQEMHPKLVGLWSEFAANEKILSAIISKTSRSLHERLLGRIAKKHGKDHQRYYHKKVALDARTLLRLLPEGKAEAATAGKALGAFDKLVREMDSNAKKGKEPSGYSSFRREANDFVKACKGRVRRLKRGKAYSIGEQRSLKGSSGWTVKGSYAKVIHAFNDLIDHANRVRF